MLIKIKSDVFKKRYGIQTKSVNFKKLYILFETEFFDNFTNQGILKINTSFHYQYNNLNNKLSHEYNFYNQKGVMFYRKY